MKRELCSICKSEITHIFSLNNVPIKLICTSIPMYENLPLSFSQCINCNTIQLDELIPLNELYSESHNYTSQGKTWENYFDLFIKKIKPIIENKIVLEIGCPSGKIALNVNNFKEWIIVEPNKNLDILFSEKVTFIEKFFDKEFCLDYKIDIIIHSHLFEHIYDFREFLNKCYEILDDNGEMVFGIPNMQNFAETDICPFLGIFFEHTCFLNNDNISILLNESGFEIVDCIYYEKHSVLYHCKKLNNISLKKINKVTNYYDSFINTLDVYKNFVKHANNCIKNTNKEVYIFGASYNTQLIISLGLDISNIKGILDNCKEKQKKYLYGFNLMVCDPSTIINKNCIVILKNGYYLNEVYNQLTKLNPTIEILS